MRGPRCDCRVQFIGVFSINFIYSVINATRLGVGELLLYATLVTASFFSFLFSSDWPLENHLSFCGVCVRVCSDCQIICSGGSGDV